MDAPPGAWVMDRAWIPGLTGAVVVVCLALWAQRTDALDEGIWIGGRRVAETREGVLLVCLLVTAGAMLLVEAIRLLRREGRTYLRVHPAIRSRRLGAFVEECGIHFLLHLALLALVIFFYKTTNEYGFRVEAEYYGIWFRLLEWAWAATVFLGFPYVILTRALRYSEETDRRDYGLLLGRALRCALSRIPGLRVDTAGLGEGDARNLRSLLVKLFFAPLMTVFFSHQFPHLVSNLGYLLETLPETVAAGTYTHRQFNTDLFNVSISLLFTIDVGLAWCGYVVSSRWVENETLSTEPTVLGWVVCLCCYPPFQMFLGLYYAAPDDREILSLEHPWVVTLFTILMALSYLVYVSATVVFGVRFSNLTHRGIIRNGPFAVVRHPAYAAKNAAWWLLMFPTILFGASADGWSETFGLTAGLVIMTGFYYLRAITEERHLSMDPAYRAYCRQVRHRFIPGIL